MLASILWIGILFLSLITLVKSSQLFLDDAEKLGVHYGMSSFIIGITIVAFGTSLPELVSSVFAMIAGVSEIVPGNVVGSNIANILLVLGLTAVVSKHPIDFSKNKLEIDILLLMVSVFVLTYTLWDGVFLWKEGIVFLLILVVYLYIMKRNMTFEIEKLEHEIIGNQKKELPKLLIPSIILSVIGIFLGAKYTIESVVVLSQVFHVGAEKIAMSAIALGTSLPELTVSIMIATKGKAEMMVGNILGSNIFNTLIVLSIPSLMGTILVPQDIRYLSLPVMVFATLLFLGMLYKKRIKRWEGVLMVCCYVAFVIKLFI